MSLHVFYTEHVLNDVFWIDGRFDGTVRDGTVQPSVNYSSVRARERKIDHVRVNFF